MWKLPRKMATAILNRDPFESPQLAGYLTLGNTFIIASPPTANDDDEYHDLAAITPWGDLTVLRPTAQVEHFKKLLEHGLDWEGVSDV